MKKEIITQILLTPDEGKYLTNGKTTVPTNVILPKGADDSVWYEITGVEYNRITESEELHNV